MTSPPRVSVAIPLYNESEGFPELMRRLTGVLDAIPGGPHEIVFVDDGSADGTFETVAAAAAADPRIVGVVALAQLRASGGALAPALDHATGDVVVVMDGDLQDPPEAIPSSSPSMQKGFDVVYARAPRGKEDSCCAPATTSSIA